MKEQMVYIGSYAQGTDSRGIHALALDMESGALRPVGSIGGCENPSFIIKHGNILYAASERADRAALASYHIDEDGALYPADLFETEGSGTCHLAISRDGRHVIGANYSSGSVFAVQVNEEGRFVRRTAFISHQGSGPAAGRQEGPHAHFVSFLPGGRQLLCCDLGADRVMAYEYLAEEGSLIPRPEADIIVRPGFGPRHFACTPDGRHLYLIGELSNEILHFRLKGSFQTAESKSALPASFEGISWASHIALSPDGRFLCAANRGHDSIAVFLIDPSSGRMGEAAWYPCGGRWPRHFAVSGCGNYMLVANQYSNDVSTWRLDKESGGLAEPTGRAEIPSPSCVCFG